MAAVMRQVTKLYSSHSQHATPPASLTQCIFKTQHLALALNYHPAYEGASDYLREAFIRGNMVTVSSLQGERQFRGEKMV